ncbi:unnamed protein product [Prunus armeniaca]
METTPVGFPGLPEGFRLRNKKMTFSACVGFALTLTAGFLHCTKNYARIGGFTGRCSVSFCLLTCSMLLNLCAAQRTMFPLPVSVCGGVLSKGCSSFGFPLLSWCASMGFLSVFVSVIFLVCSVVSLTFCAATDPGIFQRRCNS